MLTQTERLTFQKEVQAEPSVLFRAFTNPSVLRDWMCNAVEVDARKGGRFYLWWDDGDYSSGTITELTRNESLAFTWRGKDQPAASTVRVTFGAKGGKTTVNVEHLGIVSEDTAAIITRIWEAGLENLQSVVEDGVDLRFVRRPMFGLNDANELTPEKAADLGVPAKEGIWLGGLVEGMGAHAAGIQRDDVLVSLAGKDITNFQSFRAALDPYQAGDKVPASFYRGSERHDVTIELSRRKMTEVPANREELAERLRACYAISDPELKECFKGITEEEAGYRPAPDEWSAKHILAHLICSERDIQTWIAGTIEDSDVENVFHSNGIERMNAMVLAYPTTSALLEELWSGEVITLAMIAALPAKIEADKYFLYQLADSAANSPDHVREHIRDIKKLVEAARSK